MTGVDTIGVRGYNKFFYREGPMYASRVEMVRRERSPSDLPCVLTPHTSLKATPANAHSGGAPGAGRGHDCTGRNGGWRLRTIDGRRCP